MSSVLKVLFTKRRHHDLDLPGKPAPSRGVQTSLLPMAACTTETWHENIALIRDAPNQN